MFDDTTCFICFCAKCWNLAPYLDSLLQVSSDQHLCWLVIIHINIQRIHIHYDTFYITVHYIYVYIYIYTRYTYIYTNPIHLLYIYIDPSCKTLQNLPWHRHLTKPWRKRAATTATGLHLWYFGILIRHGITQLHIHMYYIYIYPLVI